MWQTSLGRLVGLSYSFRRLVLLPRIQAEHRHRPATLGFAPPGGKPRGTAEKQHGPVPSTWRPFPISSEVPPEKLRACRALWSPGAPGPQPREWSRRQEEDDQAHEPRKRGFLKLWVWSCVFVLRKLLLCAGLWGHMGVETALAGGRAPHFGSCRGADRTSWSPV